MAPPTDIVVVDDNPDILSMLEVLLSDTYRVVAFPDGANALDFLRSTPTRLLVTDLRMPGIDGLTVANEARRIDPAMKVLLISGHAEFDDPVSEELSAGDVDSFLAKPFNCMELVNRVRFLLSE